MEINFNTPEGKALLKKLTEKRGEVLEDIYDAGSEKGAERLRGFIDALDYVVRLPSDGDDSDDENVGGNVYDCSE